MSNDTPASKACSKCGEVKPLGEFHKSKAKKDGHVTACKVCCAARSRAYYEANKDKVDARNRAYYEANKDKMDAYGRAWYEANKDTVIAKQRAYYEVHKDKRDAIARAYREANKDKRNAYNRAYYEANKDQVAARIRAYREANPHKNAERLNRRRARQRANGVYQVTDKDLQRIYASPCAACGATGKVEADHVIPIARGGHHGIGNLQPLCRTCNASKHDRLMIEWMSTRRSA